MWHFSSNRLTIFSLGLLLGAGSLLLAGPLKDRVTHTHTHTHTPIVNPVRAAVGTVTIDQSVGGTSTFGNVAFQKLTDTANAAYFIDPAATGDSLVVAGTATASGNLTVGNTSAIRSAFGPLTLQYKSGLDAWATGLTIQDGTGNVGIGTTGPTAKLQVSGGITLSGALAMSNGQYISFGGATGFSGDGTNTIVKSADATGSILFRNAAESLNLVAITNSGNVGIGTTGPEKKFHVYDSVNTEFAKFTGANTTGGGIEIEASNTGGRKYALFSSANAAGQGAGKFVIRDQTGNAERFTIDSTGNVGIGTTSPSTILSVVQTSATDPIADAWTTYSSRRWKTNIIPLERSLPTVLQLQPVRFQWKADGKRDFGLIAEDVGKFLPEAVAYEANGVDAKSIDYDKIVPLLIKSIQELTVENEALKRRMAALEAR